jgi:hypothetical protein
MASCDTLGISGTVSAFYTAIASGLRTDEAALTGLSQWTVKRRRQVQQSLSA